MIAVIRVKSDSAVNGTRTRVLLCILTPSMYLYLAQQSVLEWQSKKMFVM
jgi:hypothetical protein